MREERKPVMCPWCGRNMEYQAFKQWDGRSFHSGAYRCLGCRSMSPIVRMDEKELVRELAYNAATQRPPNLPLTLPALFELEEDDAVWVVSENGRIWAMGAECAQEWASEEHCLFFARKPTNAYITAARAGKGEEHA